MTQDMEVVDNWKQHREHDTYDPQCSSCFTARRIANIAALKDEVNEVQPHAE